MSDKPDDIPQWAWDEAWELSPGGELTFTESVELVARAILQARSQAFEEAAGFLQKNHTIIHGEPADPVMPELIQAIRQHSQKGRDTE